VCPINVAEFYAGIDAQHRPVRDLFFASLHYWSISQRAAIQAGQWRYQFARQGVQLPTTDTLVAAVADEQQAIIITGNVKDYPMGVQLLPLTK
jgi:predicted nucleic acid-binding protein